MSKLTSNTPDERYGIFLVTLMFTLNKLLTSANIVFKRTQILILSQLSHLFHKIMKLKGIFESEPVVLGVAICVSSTQVSKPLFARSDLKIESYYMWRGI